jgi:NAD(P)-dependent dehydrogenase (short-subunit alcohol dehydrogenase family)
MIAHSYITNGAKVYLISRKPECITSATAFNQSLQPKHECIGIQADLGRQEEIDKLVQTLKSHEPNGINILINNAGTNYSAPLEMYPLSAFHKVMTLNLTNIFYLTQQLEPLLQQQFKLTRKPSRVINIGSINGLTPPSFPTYAYSSSKAALHHLTKHLSLTMAPQITVNAVAPGAFPSKMMAETLEAFEEVIVASTPMKRLGQPSDMAGVCLWLGSEAGTYVTGAIIVVDGGALLAKL